MSAAPSEPEKYSIDEMMERLKTSPPENPENGELVTRPDGSKAIRVRKRKRRTSQPHKEEASRNRRAKIFQVAAALILVFVAALIIGAGIIYANSAPFRESLVRKIAAGSGASVELQQFRMNPQTANAGGLVLDWPEGNVLDKLSLRGLTAEIFPSSFLGKAMKGEEVSAAEGTLQLRVPEAGAAITAPAEDPVADPVHFNRYRIAMFHVTLGDPASPMIRLMKSEGSLYPPNISTRTQMRLHQGELFVSGLPKFRLDRGLIEFRGSETDIVGLRILHETDDRGNFELAGTVQPYQPDQASTLSVKLESFLIAGVAGPDLGRLVSGRIDSTAAATSNYLSFLPAGDPSPTLEIGFQVSPDSRIELAGMPFLSALAQTLDDEWFKNPVFGGDAGGVIHRENGKVTLRDIHFESKGRMAMKGEITVDANRALSGTVRLGVADAMIITSPTPRLRTMFGPVEDGFRWIELRVSGSAIAPSDNFRQLYDASEEPVPGAAAPEDSPGSTFEELTRPR